MEKHFKNLKDNENGFTLIELMVVVVILAILAAVAIPLYQGSITDNLAGEATQTMSSWKTAELSRIQAGQAARSCASLNRSTNFTYAAGATNNICVATCDNPNCDAGGADTVTITLAAGPPPTATVTPDGAFN